MIYENGRMLTGRHKRKPLTAVPTDWMRWALIHNYNLPPLLVRDLLRELHRRHSEVMGRYGLEHLSPPFPPVWMPN